jgi:hypothetical protein
MSTTDKTRQQLVASMRKTKTAAASRTAAGSKAPRQAGRTAKSAKKTAAGAVRKRAVKAAGRSPAGTRDSYQAGRRVWPD